LEKSLHLYNMHPNFRLALQSQTSAH